MFIDDQILIRTRMNVKLGDARFLLLVRWQSSVSGALQQILRQKELGVNHAS